jgi:hypothetical protein
MAVVATNGWQHLQQWHAQDTRPRFQYAQPQPVAQPPSSPSDFQIPPRNETELSREMLIMVLTYFSTLIPSHFNGLPVRLVVHGGACMLLHPGLHNLALQLQHLSTTPNNSFSALPRRTTTRDVDYIHRSFTTEWQHIGITDATERLRDCIQTTARHFRLGADWMNSDADIALPMANESVLRHLTSDDRSPNRFHVALRESLMIPYTQLRYNRTMFICTPSSRRLTECLP